MFLVCETDTDQIQEHIKGLVYRLCQQFGGINWRCDGEVWHGCPSCPWSRAGGQFDQMAFITVNTFSPGMASAARAIRQRTIDKQFRKPALVTYTACNRHKYLFSSLDVCTGRMVQMDWLLNASARNTLGPLGPLIMRIWRSLDKSMPQRRSRPQFQVIISTLVTRPLTSRLYVSHIVHCSAASGAMITSLVEIVLGTNSWNLWIVSVPTFDACLDPV